MPQRKHTHNFNQAAPKRRGGGFKLAGTEADLELKRKAAEAKKAREATLTGFSKFNFETTPKDTLGYRELTQPEVTGIAWEQGQSSFNPKVYADENMAEERHQEYLSKLSNKELKKLRVGVKAKAIKDDVSAQQKSKKDSSDESIFHHLEQSGKIDDSIISNYLRLKTPEGIVNFLITALKMGLKTDSDLVPHMYLELLHLDPCGFEKQVTNVLKRVNEQLKMSPEKWIHTQMTEMSQWLPPLNKFSRREKKLDPWQKYIMTCIDQNKNVILVAKTSAGKTVCSTYAVHAAEKVLYVCPSNELAEQVFGLIHNQLGGHTLLVTDKDVFDISSTTNVIIGTPHALESFLRTNLDLKFDYTIYDEVHSLNGPEGESLENLIKTVSGKFLALSATVENPEELASWWKSINPEVEEPELVKHDSRFIVQQRYLWHNETNELQTLNPLAAVDDLEYVKQNGLRKGTLSFTSRDTYNLWLKLKERFPDWSPEKFFLDKDIQRLSLDDSKDYERFLKDKLKELTKSEPDFVMSILSSYTADYTPGTEDQFEIYKLVRWLFTNKMTPALCFQLNQDKVQQMFSDLVKFLQDGENKKYPYFREDIEIQHEMHTECSKTISAKQESSKVPKGQDASDFFEELSKEINEVYLTKFQTKMQDLIEKRRRALSEIEIEPEVRAIHEKYLRDKQREVSNMNRINDVNPFQAHPEFSFNDGYLNDHDMRDIKRRLSKQLGTNLSYDHPVMLGIERGISMYFDTLPLPFQRVIKGLFCDKKLTVLFSDETLAYGVNMPVRTVALIGDNIKPLVAQQMAGRAGRRGVDNQGHVVYVNSLWRDIMKGALPRIVGHNKINPLNILQRNFQNTPIDIMKKYFLRTLTDFIKDQERDVQLTDEQLNDVSRELYIQASSSLFGYLEPSHTTHARIIWNMRHLQNAELLPLYLTYLRDKYRDGVKESELTVISREVLADLITLIDTPTEGEPTELEVREHMIQLCQNLKTLTKLDIHLVSKSTKLVDCFRENRIQDYDMQHKINIVVRLKKIVIMISKLLKLIQDTEYQTSPVTRILEHLFKGMSVLVSKYEDTGSV